MFHPSIRIVPVSKKPSRASYLALLFLLAPLVEAGTIRVPEQIRIDVNWKPENISFDFALDLDDGDAATLDEVLYTGLYFRTYYSHGTTPWLEAGYGELFPESTAHDLNATLRKFLFEESFGAQRYDFMKRVSLNDTYLFAFESYVNYVPNGCRAFREECLPLLSAAYAGETMVTFYDSDQGASTPTSVALPGSLPLGMIAALGIYWRTRGN